MSDDVRQLLGELDELRGVGELANRVAARIGKREQRHAALVAAIEALVAKWHRANQWGDRHRADELAAALEPHR